MSLQDALDTALQDVPDCKVISYIDIASGLVLRKAVDAPVAQEILDRLAAVAAAIWQGGTLSGFVSNRLDLEQQADGYFILKGPRHTYLFARSAKYEEHAICFRCGADVAPSALYSAARSAIGVIADAY